MCGRYTLSAPGEVVAELFGLPDVPTLAPRFNVAPTQESLVVRAAPGGGRHADLLRWGLVPAWADDPAIGNRMINARSEGVAEKPAFRSSFKSKRCLVAADGFFEWQKLPGGKKQPWHIRLASGEPFAIAGLWARWTKGDEPLETFTILTTAPNEVAGAIHDRMPVILARNEYDRWLDPEVSDPEALQALLDAYPAAEMVAHPVSTRVGSPSQDDPGLVEPIGPAGGTATAPALPSAQGSLF